MSQNNEEKKKTHPTEGDIASARVLCECNGMNPLIFAICMCDEDLLAQYAAMPACAEWVNAYDKHDSQTALHYAVDANELGYVQLLVAQKADVELKTRDRRVLYGHVEPGGRTALHVAAASGSGDIAAWLVGEAGADVHAQDSDGWTPLDMASVYGRAECVAILSAYTAPDTQSEGEEKEKSKLLSDAAAWSKRCSANAQARLKQLCEPMGPFLKVATATRVMDVQQCARVLQAVKAVTAKSGWTSDRHTSYATTDIPAYKVPSVYALVCVVLRDTLFPAIAAHFDVPHASISVRDLFYVRYSAAPGQQADLSLHRDGSYVSFNVLLNPESQFEGGGTYVQCKDHVYTIAQGDAFLHSGQLLHAGALITSGERFILVGFLNVKHEDYVSVQHKYKQ
jgi:hypothetical protein